MHTIYVGKVFTLGQLDFVIYPKDHEPPHVHVKSTYGEAVLTIETQELMKVFGFRKATVNRIQDEVRRRRDELMEVWNEMQG